MFIHKVIHLDRSTDRLQAVNDINQKLLSFSNELNIDSYEISNDEQLNSFYSDYPEFNINRGKGFKYTEVGVWASNYSAWVKFLETDAEYLIIFEDDVSIYYDFSKRIQEAIGEMPKDWDALFFLTPEGNQRYYYKAEEHDIGLPNICRSYQGNWLGGYMLNRKGAEKLIEDLKMNMICDPIDIYIFYVQKVLNSYNFKPSVPNFGEDLNLPTTIHNSKRIGE